MKLLERSVKNIVSALPNNLAAHASGFRAYDERAGGSPLALIQMDELSLVASFHDGIPVGVFIGRLGSLAQVNRSVRQRHGRVVDIFVCGIKNVSPIRTFAAKHPLKIGRLQSDSSQQHRQDNLTRA